MKIKAFIHLGFLLMLIISFLTACNKEKESVTPNTLLKLDKVTISDGTFRNYTYDALGRRSRVDYKDYYITYNYSTSTVIETHTFFDPTKTGTVYTHTLNAQGLATKRSHKTGTITYTRDTEHDSNGRIIKLTNKNTTSSGAVSITSEIFYKYDNEGDWVSTEARYPSSPSSNYTSQYTIDKNHYNTTGVEFSGAEWIGKLSLHVQSKLSETRSDGAKMTMDYPITYDTKGYILSQIQSYSLNFITGVGTTISTANYTYK